MLRIDVRALRQGSVATEATVPAGDSVFDGLDVELDGPVTVTGTLQQAGQETYRWAGTVQGRVRGQCRRCLADLSIPFSTDAQAVFTTVAEVADDPGVYRLQEPVTAIDLGGPVREEVALTAPAYPLCRDDCAGLCPRCGADLNQGPCGCARPDTA